jgi:hypothetical protein
LEDPGVVGSINLIWVLRKQGEKMWIGFIWLRISPMAESCEHASEGGEFLDQLNDYQFLKKDSVPWT